MKQINWKDFKIKDLQPNLIENGWDSFEPYGSGENFVDNWDFGSDLLWFSGDGMEQEIVNNELHIKPLKNNGALYKRDLGYVGEVAFRIKIKGIGKCRFGSQPNPSNTKLIDLTNKWEVHEVTFTSQQNTQVGLYLLELGNIAEIDWIQITPVDNQHLVVEKTPLGNGLTRIQTWGGNSVLKLISTKQGHDTQYSASLYLETYKPLMIRTSQLSKTFETGYKGKYSQTENNPNPNLLRFTTTDKILPLDFIASDPQIVEGDKHNPALIVTELDNGQEHVQVYGAYPDTKLISKEVQGFSGEPYQIKTDIDNEGLELSMTSTLGDKSIDINKGSNSISHTGELQGQHIIIELGAKYE